MPSGIEATRIITTEFPGNRVILLTMYDPGMFSDRAFVAVASAYLLKGCGTAEVLAAIAEFSLPLLRDRCPDWEVHQHRVKCR